MHIILKRKKPVRSFIYWYYIPCFVFECNDEKLLEEKKMVVFHLNHIILYIVVEGKVRSCLYM